VKTPKQELEERAAIEHDDPTGLYDNISINGAIAAFAKYLLEKRQELQQPEYNPSTYQGSYAILGKEQIIDELVETLKNELQDTSNREAKPE
jgi:hypothetical protein